MLWRWATVGAIEKEKQYVYSLSTSIVADPDLGSGIWILDFFSGFGINYLFDY
jgi:hypothetical protein